MDLDKAEDDAALWSGDSGGRVITSYRETPDLTGAEARQKDKGPLWLQMRLAPRPLGMLPSSEAGGGNNTDREASTQRWTLISPFLARG
uniref:Uncharacterized protein n=1 Tax=Knipowitschia caucasica TaxID=637954 RepID=A0AAV2IZ14_KNICA